MPVWIFSDGPTGIGDPQELMKGWRFPENLKSVADRIKPRDIIFFHGALDMDRLKFAEKLIVRALKLPWVISEIGTASTPGRMALPKL